MRNNTRNREKTLYGLTLFPGSRRDAEHLLEKRIKAGLRTVVYTPNLEMLAAAKQSEETRALLSRADLLVPDGIGVILLSRLRIGRRIPGIELGEGLLRIAADHGYRVFLLGGRPGVAERAAEELRRQHVGVRVVGTHDGYFGESALPALIGQLRKVSPAVLIVCMGFPKQEALLARIAEALPSLRVGIGLGGALDVWSGDVRRAPRLFRLLGLEWLFRVLCQPSRLPRLVKSLRALMEKGQRA